MESALEVAELTGVASVTAALGLSRATFYRRRSPTKAVSRPRPRPARALNEAERVEVLSVLRSEEFVDRTPVEVYTALLDRGQYLCSPRTMYRVLAENREVQERRNQRRHPRYAKPELVATGPNQVWSWDITKLRTFEKWVYLYLYVLLDIYSRYVVGWLLAETETAALGARLIEESMARHGIERGTLTTHSDRGTQMTSQTVSQLLARLGATSSFGRPKVPNDNPYSESQFKTLKYHPGFPERFSGIEDGLSYCREFFPWYNNQHAHSGLGYLAPAIVHAGRAESVLETRRAVLFEAQAQNPERFVNGPPRLAGPPREVWINKPRPRSEDAITTPAETEVSTH